MKSPESASDAANKAQDLAHDATNKAQNVAQDTADKAKSAYADATDKVKDLYDEAAAKAKDLAGNAPDQLKKAGTKAADTFNSLTTTQKLVGGALLALGITYLAGGKKRKGRKRAKTLHTLLLFVNDRIEGYKKAAAESKDAKYRTYYQDLVGQSQHFASTLNQYLTQHGESAEKGTTFKGKIYRRFMAATSAVSGHDEKAILATNVHGEQWAIAAYKKALRGNKLKGEIRETVKRQLAQSKKTYERLKMLAA